MSSLSTTVWCERERSIIERLSQVRLIAAKIHHRCPSQVLLEDLVSAGIMGLVQASNRFDPTRNLNDAAAGVRGQLFPPQEHPKIAVSVFLVGHALRKVVAENCCCEITNRCTDSRQIANDVAAQARPDRLDT